MTNKNQLIEMAMGYFRSRVLVAAARLALADALQASPKTAISLAKERADPDAMHRLLPALASFGVVAETAPGIFSLTSLGQPLQKNGADDRFGMRNMGGSSRRSRHAGADRDRRNN